MSAPSDPTPAELALAEAAALDPARRLGRYLLLERLGQGGMGVVDKALDPALGRVVAIKRLLGQADERARRRLEREARLAAAVHHPGVARLHEAALDAPEGPYLVLELVRGRPLEAALDEDHPLPPREAAALVRDVARALAAAHAAGVVHRDLKPANVMLRPDGTPCVLDLGLARREGADGGDLTRTGQLLGTPGFLAPEQVAQAREAGPQADVYGLGGLLYACLTGRPPFAGPVHLVVARVLGAPPDPPSEHAPGLDPALEALCLRCLEKDPAARPAGANAVADALDAWLAGRAPSPAGSPARRAVGPGLAAGAAVLVGAALVALGARADRGPGTADGPPGRPPSLEGRASPGPPPPLATAEPARPASGASEPGASPARPREPSPGEGPSGPPADEGRPPRLSASPVDEGLPSLLPPGEEGAPPVLPGPPRLAGASAVGSPAAPSDLERAARVARSQELTREAQALAKRGEHARSEEASARAIELAPEDGGSWASRAFLRYKRRDYAGAAADYREAVGREPGNALHWFNLGVNLARLDPADEDALAAFSRALELDPADTDALVQRGRVLVELERLVEARADLERAVARRPRDARSFATIGWIGFRLGEHERAVAAYGRAIDLEPGEHKHRVNRAENLSELGRFAEAIADCDRALALAPREAEPWRKRAHARFRLGDLDGAEADLLQSLELDPSSAAARKNLELVRSKRR